ncbi:dihydrodipicolinate reductase [Chitinispirillum alkaliphilum]|nr:dihydrodipicolinate reductase [Chitinispirillum alkaliphilum]
MKIMVNGLPGNMAKTVISSAVARGHDVLPFSLTGSDITDESVTYEGIEFTLLKPETRNEKISVIKEQCGEFITVDYTHPSAVNHNAAFYIEHSLPFVMGTTGGDRQKLTEDVQNAGLYAVIAPNMAKQIVALQHMLETMAQNFPDLYKDYSLTVTESHQKTKADTSGTAKAIISTLNKTGIKPFTNDDINMIRNDKDAREVLGVPGDCLSGHAFHTYRLESPDKSVAFEYKHNVCGRTVYGEGTVDAVEFLTKMISDQDKQKLYTMIDVLQSGSMK